MRYQQKINIQNKLRRVSRFPLRWPGRRVNGQLALLSGLHVHLEMSHSKTIITAPVFSWEWTGHSRCGKHKESSQCVIIYLKGYFTSMDLKLRGNRVHGAMAGVCCLAQYGPCVTSISICYMNEWLNLWTGRCHQPPLRQGMAFASLWWESLAYPVTWSNQGQPDPGTDWMEGANLISHESWWQPQDDLECSLYQRCYKTRRAPHLPHKSP